ncbi:MAG: type II secretion system minor pseudopilin GspK [Lysobacterales bacterium]
MALITALLVVALATILAVSMAHHMQMDIRRTGNLLATERGYQYARGLELWAIAALELDAQESAGHDSRLEPWASELPVVELDEGRLSGRMEDLDGRFNLNNLVINGRRDAVQLDMFQRLLIALELDSNLANRCVDWIDGDTTIERDGAEDDSYGRLRQPYRAANAPFVDVSELRLVQGVTPAIFNRLAPHVSVIPVTGQATPVNVNTATVEVLMALHPLITRPIAESLFQEGRANFESLTAFFDHPELRPYAQTLRQLEITQRIGLNSQHFLARGLIDIDGRQRRFLSFIEETDLGYFVRWRSPDRFPSGNTVAANPPS